MQKFTADLKLLLAMLLFGVVAHAQELVQKTAINSNPTIASAGLKTNLRVAEKLYVPPLDTRTLDSLSLAVITPLRPLALEEKEMVKEFKVFKDTATLIYQRNDNPTPKQPGRISPFIKSSFDANLGDFGAPLDNTLAVSDNGYIVSMSNNLVQYYSMKDGKSIEKKYLNVFLGNKIGRPCDPKVYFDPGMKRYIAFAQSCDDAYDNSNIMIGFSLSSNPKDGWNFYRIKVSGAPFKANQWFDYPKLAVSSDGLFITGNIFQFLGGQRHEFVQSVVFHLDKVAGFNGGDLKYRIWYNINANHAGELPAVLLPINYAYNGTYGPGIFLIGTSPGNNANHIKLFDITGHLFDESTVINYYRIETTPYTYFAKADQMDSKIDNGDTRIQDGFYTGDKIAFVFTSGNERRFSRVNVNLLDLKTLQNKSNLIGDNANYSYAYPSVMPISEKDEPLNIVLQYNSASNTSYPDIRYKICDETLASSDEVVIHNGENVIGYYDRWGDYSGISKDYSARNSLWLSSTYANKAGVRQTLITNIAPMDELSKSAELFKQVANQSVPFAVSKKTLIQVFLKDAENVRKKIFEGTVWPGHKSLNLLTGHLDEGRYKIEVVDKANNQKIKEFNFTQKQGTFN